MNLRIVCLSGVAALALGLAACDSGIAFPGFDERPETTSEELPPPQETSPAGEQTANPLPPPPVSPPPPPPPPPPAPPPTTPPAPIPVSDTTAPEPAGDTEPGNTSAETIPVTPEEDAAPEAPEPDIPATEPDTTPDTTPPPVLPPVTPAFAYHAPGDLTPGSGEGSRDTTIYAPDMVFPILDARAFPQSMLYQPGGFKYAGDLPGDECVPENYEYPWRDNFCEKGRRASFKSASCPAGSGVHLGQDIRVGDGPTCMAMRNTYRTNKQGITNYKVVAAEDGVISGISSFTVTLKAGPRTYRYLHMNMRALQVSVGDEVTAGQHLGYVSKDFGNTATTFHLHFVIKLNTDDGNLFVPPYTSLVAAYARREGAPGEELDRIIVAASAEPDFGPPEVFEFTE